MVSRILDGHIRTAVSNTYQARYKFTTTQSMMPKPVRLHPHLLSSPSSRVGRVSYTLYKRYPGTIFSHQQQTRHPPLAKDQQTADPPGKHVAKPPQHRLLQNCREQNVCGVMPRPTTRVMYTCGTAAVPCTLQQHQVDCLHCFTWCAVLKDARRNQRIPGS